MCLQISFNQKYYKKMETFYKKVIYDICQLIKQKSFKRAVNLIFNVGSTFLIFGKKRI